jgi:hypothetical protein
MSIFRDPWFWLGALASALALSLAGLVVALVMLAGVTTGHRDEVVIVPCPSEDSCTVDYYDGAWHIGPPGSLPGSVPPSDR